MINRDDLPETPEWSYTPDPIFETPQHMVFMRGCDVALADAEVDPLGNE